MNSGTRSNSVSRSSINVSVVQFFFHNHVRHRIEQRNVCAWTTLQMNRRVLSEFNLSRIDDNQVRAFQCCLLDTCADDWVIFGRVCTAEQNCLQLVLCRCRSLLPHLCRASISSQRQSAYDKRGHSNRHCLCRPRHGQTSARDSSLRSFHGRNPERPMLSGPDSFDDLLQSIRVNEMASSHETDFHSPLCGSSVR